jgi:hypothetical protein
MDALDLMGVPYAFDQPCAGLTAHAGGRRLRFDLVAHYGAWVVVIEFDGAHHDRPVRFGGRSIEAAAEALERQRENDRIKDEYCTEEGYQLLRIKAADLMRAPRLIGDHFRERVGWTPGPLPEGTPAIPRAPAVARAADGDRPIIVKPVRAGVADAGPTAGEVAAQVLDALNAFDDEIPVRLEVEVLTSPIPELTAVAGIINARAYSLYGNNNGGARRKVIERGERGGRTAISMRATLNVALESQGLAITPRYETQRQRHRGTPAYYELHAIDPDGGDADAGDA